jgi:mannose-6-phosphate isomerase-like protein (cupin superfamily)
MTTVSNPTRPKDLVAAESGGERRYVALEHALPAHSEPAFRTHVRDLRTFIVVAGVVELDTVGADGAVQTVRIAEYDGWHADPGSVYRFRNPGSEPAAVVEAGTANGEVTEFAGTDPGRGGCRPVSGYRVDKPWGYELWYTQNLDDAPYAVKQIHMTAGHQSSLQSHRRKAETNYVVDGEATVLNGLPAPEDPDSVVEVDRIPVAVHGPGGGWTSAPGILHRVIARSDYTSIEVSTPELDDVIRWQDDTGRGDGRIAAEHRGGPR